MDANSTTAWLFSTTENDGSYNYLFLSEMGRAIGTRGGREDAGWRGEDGSRDQAMLVITTGAGSWCRIHTINLTIYLDVILAINLVSLHLFYAGCGAFRAGSVRQVCTHQRIDSALHKGEYILVKEYTQEPSWFSCDAPLKVLHRTHAFWV